MENQVEVFAQVGRVQVEEIERIGSYCTREGQRKVDGVSADLPSGVGHLGRRESNAGVECVSTHFGAAKVVPIGEGQRRGLFADDPRAERFRQGKGAGRLAEFLEADLAWPIEHQRSRAIVQFILANLVDDLLEDEPPVSLVDVSVYNQINAGARSAERMRQPGRRMSSSQ